MIHLIKFAFIFTLGGIVAVMGIRWALSTYNPKVLSASSEDNIVTEFLYQQVLPQIVESKALAPFFKTKKSVEDSVESVSTLPAEQKKAVCREICGEVLEGKKTPIRAQ